MSYVPHKKGTLLVPTGNKNHLYVIVTDVCSEGKHLLVNVSTIYPGTYYDNTCVIDDGEHPFIKHPSYVVYRQARIDKSEQIIKYVNCRYFSPHLPISDELLIRISAGFLTSAHVPRFVRKYFDKVS